MTIRKNQIYIYAQNPSPFFEVYISLKSYNILRLDVYIREKYLRVNNEDHNKQ